MIYAYWIALKLAVPALLFAALIGGAAGVALLVGGDRLRESYFQPDDPDDPENHI